MLLKGDTSWNQLVKNNIIIREGLNEIVAWSSTRFTICFLFYFSTPVDVNNKEMMLKIIKSAINTKAINRWSDLACSIALDAVKTVEFEENGRKEIDIKKYAKVEKVGMS